MSPYVQPWNTIEMWHISEDHLILRDLMDKFSSGSFGFKIDTGSMHAIGFSSGGFMTSRMAFSYSGLFKSLSIVGGGYYNCLPPINNCPDGDYADGTHRELIKHHPPTQLLHGTGDKTVPVDLAQRYHANLDQNSMKPTRLITTNQGHTWIRGSVEAVIEWMEEYNE